MPIMPGAIWRGDQSSKRRMTRYDVFCIHTIVGYAPAHAAHFSVFADGDIYQSRDTLYTSAANLDGNHRVIASENEDHGPRFGGTPQLPRWVPLTDEQVKANAEIYKWLHDEHGIPLQLNPNSRPTSRGIGYHRQGIDGNFTPEAGFRFPGRVSGGEVWTGSRGKVCPTDARIEQVPTILALARGDQEDPMADYAGQLDRIEKQGKANAEALAKLERARTNTVERDKDTKRLIREVLAEVRE